MKSIVRHLVALPVETKFGVFVARYSEKGLAELHFPSATKVTFSVNAPLQINRWHKITTLALQQLLENREPKELPPLDLAGTEFQKRVWAALQKIKVGSTKSYAELGASIGQPKGARAVGSACGANPIPVLIPCHRVLAANKKIGGFSGGIEWKHRLLALENCENFLLKI
jgi:O-6-methylguanine DNA methyltransferase